MESLQRYKDAIRRYGETTAEVDSLIEQLLAASNAQEQAVLLAALDGWPCGRPQVFDRDYAALALQAASAEASPELRKLMLNTALGRAIWYASGATSGGEGLARSSHVEELHAAYAAA